MNIIKYITLFLIFCNIPSYLLAYFGSGLGSIASYTSSFIVLIYFFLTREKNKPLLPFILLGILFYILGGLNYSGTNEEVEFVIKDFIRFMIIVLFAGEVLYKTTNKDIYIILLIGAVSIVINAVVFPLANANFYPSYGRFSGFYLNPNFAGSICLVGYALSYAIPNKILKLTGLILFTLAGILTFSRSFIVIWLLLNIISIYNNKKNMLAPALGSLVLLLVFAISSKLTLNADRFKALQSIFGEEKIQTNTIQEDSRTDTWALYTDLILDRPFLGNGYESFKIKLNGLPGVHNSFLLVIGEAGILPFLVIIGIYLYLLYKGILNFKLYPEYLYITVVLIMSLMVGHGYFDNYYNVILSMYLYIQYNKIASNQQLSLSIT